MFFLGFFSFLILSSFCFHQICLALFEVGAWTVVTGWWDFGHGRVPIIFFSLAWLTSAIFFGFLLQRLGLVLFGKAQAYLYLGRALDKGLYVAKDVEPQKEIYLPGLFDIFGSANFDSLYRRIWLIQSTGHHKQYFAPNSLRLFIFIIFIVASLLTLFFGSLGALQIIKGYALSQKLYPEYFTSLNFRIEPLINLLKDHPQVSLMSWIYGLLGFYLFSLVLFYFKRPRHLFERDRILPLPRQVKPDQEMKGLVLDKSIRYKKSGTKTSQYQKKEPISHINYLIKLEEDFQPPVYMTWICENFKGPLRKEMDQALEKKGAVKIRIRNFVPAVKSPKPGEAPYTFEVIEVI